MDTWAKIDHFRKATHRHVINDGKIGASAADAASNEDSIHKINEGVRNVHRIEYRQHIMNRDCRFRIDGHHVEECDQNERHKSGKCQDVGKKCECRVSSIEKVTSACATENR